MDALIEMLGGETNAWWACTVAVAGVQAVIALEFSRRQKDSVPDWARFCFAAFSVGALLRSAFPIRWSTRPHACLIDTPFRVVGGHMFDRVVAQTAEVSFGALVAFSSDHHLAHLGLPRTAAVARACAWPIVLAQCCCWIGEITDNKLWHVYEESLWGSTFAVHAALACFALVMSRGGGGSPIPPPTVSPAPLRRTWSRPRGAASSPTSPPRLSSMAAAPTPKAPVPTAATPEEAAMPKEAAVPKAKASTQSKAKDATEPSAAAEPTDASAATARRFLMWLGLLSAPYVYFMLRVDAPMYYRQWRSDEANGTAYDGWADGLERMLICQEVASDWAGWSEDALWQTLYFGVAPLAALALAASLRTTPES